MASLISALQPLGFRLHSIFSGREDRMNETYNPGRFFKFNYFGGQFNFLVTDQEQWANPPTEGESCWLEGYIVSNQFLTVFPCLNLVVPSSSKDYKPPVLDEIIDGCPFSGIAKIEKKSGKNKTTGEDYYQFLIRAMGLLVSVKTEPVFYNSVPENKFILIAGLLNCVQSFDNKSSSFRHSWDLTVKEFKEISGSRQPQ